MFRGLGCFCLLVLIGRGGERGAAGLYMGQFYYSRGEGIVVIACAATSVGWFS